MSLLCYIYDVYAENLVANLLFNLFSFRKFLSAVTYLFQTEQLLHRTDK